MMDCTSTTFYDCTNTIYQIIKAFLDNKMSNFEEYGAFIFVGFFHVKAEVNKVDLIVK